MLGLVESLDVLLVDFVEFAEFVHFELEFVDAVFEHFDVHSGSFFVFRFFLFVDDLLGLSLLQHFFCFFINMYITIIPFFDVSGGDVEVEWGVEGLLMDVGIVMEVGGGLFDRLVLVE